MQTHTRPRVLSSLSPCHWLVFLCIFPRASQSLSTAVLASQDAKVHLGAALPALKFQSLGGWGRPLPVQPEPRVALM